MQLSDNIKIFLGDVVIVLFHLAEGVLVVDHQVIDVLVLALLDFVDLDLHAQRQLLVQLLHLVLVDGDQIDFIGFEGLLELFDRLLCRLVFALYLTDVGLIGLLEFLFVLSLSVSVLAFDALMMGVFIAHDLGSLRLDHVDLLSVLVLVMLHLLQMGYHKRVVRVFLFLHLCVKVLDLRLKLLDLLPGVLIEVVDHVLLNLQSVTLHLRVLELCAQVLDLDLQLLAPHGHELVLRLGLLLLALLPLSLLFLTGHRLGVSTFENSETFKVITPFL